MREDESRRGEILPGSLLGDPALLNALENPRIKTAPVTHGRCTASPCLFGKLPKHRRFLLINKLAGS